MGPAVGQTWMWPIPQSQALPTMLGSLCKVVYLRHSRHSHAVGDRNPGIQGVYERDLSIRLTNAILQISSNILKPHLTSILRESEYIRMSWSQSLKGHERQLLAGILGHPWASTCNFWGTSWHALELPSGSGTTGRLCFGLGKWLHCVWLLRAVKVSSLRAMIHMIRHQKNDARRFRSVMCPDSANFWARIQGYSSFTETLAIYLVVEVLAPKNFASMPATPQSSQHSDHREWWASTWFHSMNKSVWVLLKLSLQQLSQQSVIFLGGHPRMEINMQHQLWPLTGHGPGEVDDFQIAGPNRNGLIHIWYYMIPI